MKTENKNRWLKFQKDFFKSLRIKKLRRLAGGDTYTIIYLKLQLLALATDGYLEYKGIFESFEEEMAEEIEEEIENIKVAVSYLLACGLIEKTDNVYFLPYVPENVGIEITSTDRVRKCRENKKILQVEQETTEVKKKSKVFVKPTIEEVAEYCRQRGNNVDAQTFIDFYECKGWMVGKNKMKDWKAAVRTWERNRSNQPKQDGVTGWFDA